MPAPCARAAVQTACAKVASAAPTPRLQETRRFPAGSRPSAVPSGQSVSPPCEVALAAVDLELLDVIGDEQDRGGGEGGGDVGGEADRYDQRAGPDPPRVEDALRVGSHRTCGDHDVGVLDG